MPDYSSAYGGHPHFIHVSSKVCQAAHSAGNWGHSRRIIKIRSASIILLLLKELTNLLRWSGVSYKWMRLSWKNAKSSGIYRYLITCTEDMIYFVKLFWLFVDLEVYKTTLGWCVKARKHFAPLLRGSCGK